VIDDFKKPNGEWAKATFGRGGTTLSGAKWYRMLARCEPDFQRRNPTYSGCTCEFASFQEFVEWHRSQINYGKGLEIDKDLLIQGNKVYGPNTCTLLPAEINKTLRYLSRSGRYLPIGVQFSERNQKYVAACAGESGSRNTLGYFKTSDEAFQAYKAFKEELLKKYAEDWKHLLDPRAYEALQSFVVLPCTD
jgi:hypothetical protein